MKHKQEIKDKIKELKDQAMVSIKRRYPNSGKFASRFCSPRIHSKIIALEWVVE